jgi:hypothetical protein
MAAHAAAQGASRRRNRARLKAQRKRQRMPKLDFIPERDGFHFRNSFVNHVLDGPIRIETVGRCGGMAAASIDYRRTSIPIPTHVPADLPGGDPGGIPAEGTRLPTFIYDRLLSTIIRPEGFKFVLGPWVTDADWYQWSMNDEFPKFRRRVDAGMLSVVGLWSRQGGVGEGHQIVCYGYEADPSTLWVYDNNYPDLECRLVGLGPEQGVAVERPDGGRSAYRGYFLHDIIDYGAAAPRPPYIDLGISHGVTLEPGAEVPAGQRLACTVTVGNYGDYPARLRGHPFPTRPGWAKPRRPARRPRQRRHADRPRAGTRPPARGRQL